MTYAGGRGDVDDDDESEVDDGDDTHNEVDGAKASTEKEVAV